MGVQRKHPHQMLVECKEHFQCKVYRSWAFSTFSTWRWHGGQKTLSIINYIDKRKVNIAATFQLDWSATSNAIKFKNQKVRGVYKDWNCSIFVRRFTKVHQCRVVIWKDIVQFVFELNTMGDDIGNKGNNV